MKINLLVELNNFIAMLGPHQKDRRGAQLLILAAQEIRVMRETNRRLHDRAQLAECALPEWKEICTATKGQATGRFYPALVRLALTDAERANAKLTEELALARRKALAGWRGLANLYHLVTGKDCDEHCALGQATSAVSQLKHRLKKQTEEQRHLYDLYFKAFELAGGKHDGNIDDLPRLIWNLVERLYPGANPEIDSTIGTIPGTQNLGPGLAPARMVIISEKPEKPLPKLPLRYRVIDGEKKDSAFIEDADGRMLFTIVIEGMRGRSTLDDLRAEAERRIVQVTRSIEEKAAKTS